MKNNYWFELILDVSMCFYDLISAVDFIFVLRWPVLWHETAIMVRNTERIVL